MSADREICVICCKEISLFAAGPCDHSVCYECTTRMRVLCEQNECPICRSDMPYVFLTHKKKSFPSRSTFPLLNKRYAIAFEDEVIEAAFKDLLQHSCDSCDENFRTFCDLQKHMRRAHSLFYCELCVENLKIFSFERKCYTRSDLAQHKRKGDSDDKSHRGHPVCEFCDKRFVDRDELYRHLRREHYFCHFCDTDGSQTVRFYSDYSFLKQHFRTSHYLCEEDDCAQEEFVCAFRTDIDFKAHTAVKHSKNKTKAEAKQARTLDLEFAITPRNVQNGRSSPNQNEFRGGGGGRFQNNYTTKRHGEESLSRRHLDDAENNKEPKKASFNTQCVQDFPMLGNEASNNSNEFATESSRYSNRVTTETNFVNRQNRIPSRKTAHLEDFPALGAPSASASHVSNVQLWNHAASNNFSERWGKPPSAPEKKVEKAQQAKKNSGWQAKHTVNLEEEFPKLKMKDPGASNKSKQEQNPSKQQDQELSQQIWQKCKSKKKKNTPSVRTNEQESNQNVVVKPQDLSKLYKGFGALNVLNHDDDKDEEDENQHRGDDYELQKKVYIHQALHKDDDVPWREKPNLMPSDFPPLAPPAKKEPNKRPPGFSSSNATKASNTPPGFSYKSITDNLVSKNCISLSSIAQQLSNNNDNVKTDEKCSYQPPTDFENRNTSLIERILISVRTENHLFDEFKTLSGKFRKDIIPASDYYSNCMKILGEDRFLQLFPELLCLLPDIKKQQELLTAHNGFKSRSKSKGAMPKYKEDKILNAFTVCQTCLQVLMHNDLRTHMTSHE